MKTAIFGILILVSIAACESNPQRAGSSGPTPAVLSASADGSVKGHTFTWGGSIVGSKNLKDRTLVEVMAYPLNASGEPLTGQQSQGRFLVDYKGFLEPTEYRPGRLLTVTGPMLGYTDGKVGDAPYRYPALDGVRMKLWPENNRKLKIWPQINLGVGIGSGGYGNIGIGIGF